MSIPPLPAGAAKTPLMKTANALHSLSIRLLRRARAADKESGLSPERLSLLSVLTYAGEQTVNRLSEIEDVSPPAISRIVSSLEKQGLARRVKSANDARSVIVNATTKGRKLMERGRLRRLEIIAEEIKPLNNQDRSQLAQISTIFEKIERAQY